MVLSTERSVLTDYLKIPEVARRLDVSEKTARREVTSGALPSVFLGGAYRVSEEDLRAFVESKRSKPKKAAVPRSLGGWLKERGAALLALDEEQWAGRIDGLDKAGLEEEDRALRGEYDALKSALRGDRWMHPENAEERGRLRPELRERYMGRALVLANRHHRFLSEEEAEKREELISEALASSGERGP